jgi:hypothetical protein
VGTPAVADLTAALEMAMNTAGSADEAANNIGNLLGKINSPTVINAFAKKFGMDLPAAMKRFQAQGMTTMEAFATATQKATGGDMKKLGWVVEDQQAQMGLLALMQNMDKYRRCASRSRTRARARSTPPSASARRATHPCNGRISPASSSAWPSWWAPACCPSSCRSSPRWPA